MSDTCIFTVPWRGECGDNTVENTDKQLCATHSHEECWCGAQAVTCCDATEGLMCGQPLCEDHGCYLRYHSGRPHDPDGREAYEEYKHEETRWDRDADTIGYRGVTPSSGLSTSPLFCVTCGDELPRDVEEITESELEHFDSAKCASCETVFYKDTDE